MGSLTQAPWPLLAMGSQVLVGHTMPSSQVGAATTVWHMPPTQASSPLQNWPSSHTIGVPAHTSLLQTSPVVHGFRSSHVAVLLGCAHVPSPSHWSSVQTSPSSVHGVSAVVRQLWAASLQVSLHSGPLAHGSPLCVQTPPLQVSVPLPKRPSLQEAVLFGCVQAPAPLHTSSVQTLPSLVRAVSAGVAQSPAAPSPVSVQATPPAQGAPPGLPTS